MAVTSGAVLTGLIGAVWPKTADRGRTVTSDPAPQRPPPEDAGDRVRPMVLFRRGFYASLGVLATAAAAAGCLHRPRGADLGADRPVPGGQPESRGTRADPLAYPPRDRHRGGCPGGAGNGRRLPAIGDPGHGRPVPRHGERLPPLSRQPATPLGRPPPDQRPVPPDQPAQQAARQPACPARQRRVRDQQARVLRAGCHPDGDGAHHLFPGRPAPAAAQRGPAVPAGSPGPVRPHRRRAGRQGRLLHDREHPDLPRRRRWPRSARSLRSGCRSPCRWPSWSR